MSGNKIREVIEKVKSGDIGLASSEVATNKTDEGGTSSITRRICGPCNAGNHGQCDGEHVCDCDDPAHQGQTQ
jgi:hypothetical protein